MEIWTDLPQSAGLALMGLESALEAKTFGTQSVFLDVQIATLFDLLQSPNSKVLAHSQHLGLCQTWSWSAKKNCFNFEPIL